MTDPTPPMYTPNTRRGSTPAGAQNGPTDVSSAKDKAADAAQTGKQAAGEVAQTATTAAKDVAAETTSQAKELAGKTGQQVNEQAGVQKDALVDGLRSLVEQLEAMTSRAGSEGGKDGIAVEAAGKARDAARSAADWLAEREPGEVLDGIRDFGRQRPGAYLGGSLLAGIVAGRLTRGVAAAHTGDSTGSAPSGTASSTTPSGTPGPRHEATGATERPGGLYGDAALSGRPTPRQNSQTS